MSDVFFDNIFTDMAFHEKIQSSIMQVTEAERSVRGMPIDILGMYSLPPSFI